MHLFSEAERLTNSPNRSIALSMMPSEVCIMAKTLAMYGLTCELMNGLVWRSCEILKRHGLQGTIPLLQAV